jgi:hypothetical protein
MTTIGSRACSIIYLQVWVVPYYCAFSLLGGVLWVHDIDHHFTTPQSKVLTFETELCSRTRIRFKRTQLTDR